VDPLSDILRLVQLSGAFMFRAELRAPWSYAVPEARTMVPWLLPEARRLVRFHVIAAGECHVLVAGESHRLGRGDVVLLPQGDAHVMCSTLELTSVPVLPILRQICSPDAIARLVHDGSGASTTILCGFLGCNEPIFDSLCAALPTVVVGRRATGDSWFEAMLDFVMHPGEKEPGAGSVHTRAIELMFVEVLRRHLASASDETRQSWLYALRDPCIGRALGELHAEPARAWTVASLAKCVGVSRSMLAERFRQVTGVAPMHYLASWRVQLAAHLLRRCELSIADVAARVGYRSEAAFHRAFKRATGEPPAAWRLKEAAAADNADERAKHSEPRP
jgi:AraC-like DNA-binding protein